jgi:hypothetical protein
MAGQVSETLKKVERELGRMWRGEKQARVVTQSTDGQLHTSIEVISGLSEDFTRSSNGQPMSEGADDKPSG